MGSRKAVRPYRDLAWESTLRRAVARKLDANETTSPLSLTTEDLQAKIRHERPRRLLFFLVDGSGSMGGQNMKIAKRLALTLLERAYQKRDQVAMVVFRDHFAELLFAPTNRTESVHEALSSLPCGGRTPLAEGLALAHDVLVRDALRNPDRGQVVILISDGRGNVLGTSEGISLQQEIHYRAEKLSELRRASVLFVDTTGEGKEDRPAQRLAEALRAPRFVLWRMLRDGRDTAQEIAEVVDSL